MIARYGDVKPLAADPHQEVFTSPAGKQHDASRSPAEFIPLAERTGLIIPLTRSLMAQVNAQMRPHFS
ncbi:Rtn protein [Klebsiella pneumoniae]|uniref:Rtn protein n=1 Tax=Klebsiella pneumoniae TaxID=573 RepID=A0A4P0XXC1_KLEPN|nr:Rtn protein [Klebsiella pneumoniae]